MRVALIHDYLTQYGGAERVLAELHVMFPDAPVYSSVADRDLLPPTADGWDVHETSLARIPFSKRIHRGLLPLYPAAFRGLRGYLSDVDVVIADSSAWAHHAGVAEEIALICYCHSPARFLYGDSTYLGPASLPFGVRQMAGLAFAGLRRSDQAAAKRVDRYVANSRNVALRIERAYGRSVSVIYPPIVVGRFTVADEPPADWFLVVSRLVPHKRIDLVIDAANRWGVPLKIVGDGRSEEALQQRAGPTVEFLGALDDADVARCMQQCRALILPGLEDFGMTAVEAQAAGRPVIAFAGGGALESILPGETGMLFAEMNVESLMDAIDRFERRQWDTAAARANAERFDVTRFRREMLEEIEAGLASRRALTADRASDRRRAGGDDAVGR